MLILALNRHISSLVVPNSDFLLDHPSLSIAMSNDHVCVLSQRHNEDEIGGEAVCLGNIDDEHGKMRPPQDATFVQIVTGSTYGCGLLLDQTVLCWGKIQTTPIQGMFTQIVGTDHYACGLMIDKQIQCFGALPAVPPPRNENGFVQFDCSNSHIGHCCALDTLGVPHCWGSHPGQHAANGFMRPPRHSAVSADGSVSEEEEEEEEDGYDDEGDDLSSDHMQFKQISVGAEFSCGISLEGSNLQCWGRSQRHPHFASASQNNLHIRGPFKQISVGGAGVCGIYGDTSAVEDVLDSKGNVQPKPRSNSLQCWGSLAHSAVSGGVAADYINRTEWDQVKVHLYSLCAVTMQSELKCYGLAYHDQQQSIIPADLIVA